MIKENVTVIDFQNLASILDKKKTGLDAEKWKLEVLYFYSDMFLNIKNKLEQTITYLSKVF